MSGLPWRSSFTFGDPPATVRFEYPLERWRPELAGLGGTRWTATGVVGAWRQADRSRLAISIRFLPHEWASVLDVLAWAQTGAPFTWTPDPDTSIPAASVVLEAPAAGADVVPVTDASYPRLRYVTLVIRRVDGADFGLDYFGGV